MGWQGDWLQGDECPSALQLHLSRWRLTSYTAKVCSRKTVKGMVKIKVITICKQNESQRALKSSSSRGEGTQAQRQLRDCEDPDVV